MPALALVSCLDSSLVSALDSHTGLSGISSKLSDSSSVTLPKSESKSSTAQVVKTIRKGKNTSRNILHTKAEIHKSSTDRSKKRTPARLSLYIRTMLGYVSGRSSRAPFPMSLKRSQNAIITTTTTADVGEQRYLLVDKDNQPEDWGSSSSTHVNDEIPFTCFNGGVPVKNKNLW